MHGLDKLVFGDIGLRFVVSNQRCLSLSVSNKRLQGKPEVSISTESRLDESSSRSVCICSMQHVLVM